MREEMIGNSYLINGDCLEVMDKLIERGVKVDCVITDPPYGTTWAKWDSIVNFEQMWSKLNKIRKDKTPVILFGVKPFSANLMHSNIKHFKYSWYWLKSNKGNFLNAKRQPLRQIEEIMVFYKNNYFPQGLEKFTGKATRGRSSETTMQNYKKEWNQEKTGYPSDLLEFKNDMNGYHPTQKPVLLMEYLIKTYTNEGDIVLDFTMGSGSTLVACENVGRRGIGIELDEKYFDIAVKRIKETQL